MTFPSRFRLRRCAPATRLTILLLCALAFPFPALLAQASASSMPLDSGFGPLDPTQPAMPVEQIIQEFTAKEALFAQALNNYTWTRSARVQTLDEDGKPNGEYYQVVDIYYTPDGKRTERVVDAPMGKLFDTTCSPDTAAAASSVHETSTGSSDQDTTSCSSQHEIIMSEKDFSDIEERLPFVLTTQDASQYDITYLGQQKVDQIDAWVFDVKPKAILKNKRYFQGRIWVDQKEHQIVVTNGKNVPDDLRPGHEDLTLPFITYRQMVDGKYWFPVYTLGEAVLHFAGGHGYLSENADMRETVKYTNYHQFHTNIRVLFNGQEIPNNSGQPDQKPAPSTPPAQQPTTVPPAQPQ